jgi:hypothetical protein
METPCLLRPLSYIKSYSQICTFFKISYEFIFYHTSYIPSQSQTLWFHFLNVVLLGRLYKLWVFHYSIFQYFQLAWCMLSLDVFRKTAIQIPAFCVILRQQTCEQFWLCLDYQFHLMRAMFFLLSTLTQRPPQSSPMRPYTPPHSPSLWTFNNFSIFNRLVSHI